MTKERPQPYIGISGVSESEPQEISTQYWLMDQFTWAGLDSNTNSHARQLLLGVKAVHKTQYLDIENKYGREWYPVGEEEFARALGPAGNIQAAQLYFDPNRVGDATYRSEFITRVCRRGQAWLNALQFDMLPWQGDEAMLPFLEQVKHDTEHTLILQAHGELMQKLGSDGVAQKLGQYAHVLDYVLFDASHGKGVRMDTESLLPFLDAAYESDALAGVGFGAAGGLDAGVVREELPVLLAQYPDISWDAEGRLHSMQPGGMPGLNWTAAKEYIQASSDVLAALPRGEVY